MDLTEMTDAAATLTAQANALAAAVEQMKQDALPPPAQQMRDSAAAIEQLKQALAAAGVRAGAAEDRIAVLEAAQPETEKLLDTYRELILQHQSDFNLARQQMTDAGVVFRDAVALKVGA